MSTLHPIAYLRDRLRRRTPTTQAPSVARSRTIRSREEVHAFWRDPDGGNKPEKYLEPTGRSEFLLEWIRPYVETDARILEIGCNVGRNMAHLFGAGYRDLTGIEINADALELLRATFPEMAATARLMNAPVEDVIRDVPDASFDLVYAMAVLEHIHPESEWIFDEIVRISAGMVVTIEDEHGVSSHHVPRDYRAVFEGRGLRQLAERGLSSTEGFPTAFQARAFEVPRPID